VREYALVLCVAAAVTYLLTPLARRFAIRIGAMAEPRDRDVHAIPTPRLGGLAMYGGIVAAFLVAHQLPALSGVFKYSDVEAITVAGGVIVLLGFVDDRWGIDALTKLAGQVVAAGVMVLLGLQVFTLTLPGLGALSLGPEGVPLTVLLALLTVNAINFVDGLDGLAAGVGAIAALAFFAFSYSLSSGTVTHGVIQDRISSPTLIAVVLAGACLGFLPHNFNPARVFMGDSGSMLIGLMLAGAATSLTGQINYGNLPAATAFPVLLPLLLPFAVLAVPFVDLLLAVVRRTRAGRSPFAPDKAHLHHRLLEIGHSHTRAVLIMYFWTALLGFGGVAMSVTGGPWPVFGVVCVLAVVALVAVNLPRLRAGRGGPPA
jgi:UDP-GlcNAc:undecaprenyl-phosphate GlcNAc-1-phosphate transferase